MICILNDKTVRWHRCRNVCVGLTFSGGALRAVLAGPAGRAVAVVVALRRVARRAVSARRAGAVVAVVLRADRHV